MAALAYKWIKNNNNNSRQSTTQLQWLLSRSAILLLAVLSVLPLHASSNSINSSNSNSSSDNLEELGVATRPLKLEMEQQQANSLPADSSSSNNLIQRKYLVMHAALNGATGSNSNNNNQNNNDHSRSLKRVSLTNSSITCNDGTHAGFYLRKQPNSKKWIVFLEGGWHCFDNRSCRARWMRLRHLMTSSQWPETRDVGGILSPHAEENPYWHNANHVLVPYCSSDSWSGTRTEPDSRDLENNWRFMGALILRQVIADLIPLGLGRVAGGELLLVGSSAGGLGVMLNLDRVRDFLVNERKLQVTVRGVSDSGWFLDREPYTPAAVASSEAVRLGWKLWQGLLPEDCTKAHPTEHWRCYFGYRLYPTLKTPLFVFQWLFDEAQMRADNVGAPVTPQQWNYIHDMGGALRSSLDNVSAVFAPSCIGHAVLSKRDWVNIKIDDISLPAALRCWEHSTRQRRKRHDKLKRSTEATTTALQQQQQQEQHPNQRHQHQQRHRQHRLQKLNNVEESVNQSNPQRKRNHLSKEQREERKRRRQQRQERQRRKQRRRQQQQQRKRENEANNQKLHRQPLTAEQQLERKQQRQQQRRRKLQQQQQQQLQQKQLLQQEQPSSEPQKRRASNSASKPATKSKQRQRLPRVPEKCGLRLLERCSWPQCNHSCPTLTNPLTGEEMRFLELLTSFGLDIEAVAAALGVDMHTLNNMERTELVNLLTQQVS
ncbi:palmitoleoyl-protein carboxylesterase NOTUM isoform X1 [Drosophila sulfurigaster albostrigata]|uniref:palmitoleoyl-protein carboxylesterase NOTUM isoform X1 n=1 Tax=Drosophila sulfurigaster albostrigata TaxID=89887 RepID=UPI002D218EE9|nr:palmitoleoyl-protein carboxylesterase NOTUM isoform X1 [Drosophila sulfurigaster albostrigata]